MFAILVVNAVLYPVSNIISSLVKEKELRIKEGLKMMGLTDAAHTASWTFHFMCLFFFTSLFMVLCSGAVFEFRCQAGFWRANSLAFVLVFLCASKFGNNLSTV